MPARLYTIEQEKVFAQDYQNGLTCGQVALKHNVNRNTMITILRRQNVTFRLRQGDFKRIYTLDNTVFDDLNNEHACYWLGFLFADGFVSRNRNEIKLTLNNKDRIHVKMFNEFLKTDRMVRDAKIIYKGQSLIVANTSVRDNHLANQLRKLGIEPTRPRPLVSLESIPITMYHHWVRGWFDGDGSVTSISKRNQLRLQFLGHHLLVDKVKNIFENELNTTRVSPTKVQTPHLRTLNYTSSSDIIKLHTYLYDGATTWLGRKRNKLDSWLISQLREPLTRDAITASWIQSRIRDSLLRHNL